MVAYQKNEGKSRSSTRGRITHAAAHGVFICAADHKGRAIFLHQKASRASLFVRIYPTHSSFGIAPVFYASNIAHTVLRPLRSGQRDASMGQRVSSGDQNRVRDYSAFFTTNPQYAGKSMYREKRIFRIYASNETDPFAIFLFLVSLL